MIFDARTLARGWLSVAVASSADKDRPALHRTVSVEQYEGGLRLAATDSYVLLTSWVPSIDYDLDAGPDFDEAPLATAIVEDPHGRAKGFLGYALTLVAEAARDDYAEPIEITVRLGVRPDADEEQDAGILPGLSATYFVLELPDVERLKLTTYEGEFPSWRRLVSVFEARSTKTIALNPEIVGRLAKLGKIQPGALLGFEWGGAERAGRVELVNGDPYVEGLVMPCRWDFDRNAPRPEKDEKPETEEVDA